ncbi:MAG: bifunctional phosphoribosyl-AMP cyclohydrolase/phosphoribosyl-ATP diphosphatase HisIE [Cyclobacteriaceae bacterium]|nr:bifunctional phosphoribosyl-AMP cyclohydrolase/phosphoribosyl-ATP diphosphatase HisIE [Cyclobacteriaceae bacterium]
MELDFQKGQGLIPAIIQDSTTQQILMLGYMNEEALNKTRESGTVTFFSRSKNRLWTKGETSGNHLWVESIHGDCDGDTLLVKARATGPTCHLGTTSCFQDDQPASFSFLLTLQNIIRSRKENPSSESYTSSLIQSGTNKIAQKVGEEAVEVVIEATNQNLEKLHEESADLVFHLMVLLEQQGSSLKQVIEVLRSRHKD